MSRARIYSSYIRRELDGGLSLMRAVQTPADRRVQVKSHTTGQVREMVMFGSNNYLGLANDPAVRERLERHVFEFGAGLGGPPLLNGTTELHRTLEHELAAFKGCEEAMLFSSGFAAGYGLLSAIAAKRDAVIVDELAHTSLKEGARASKGRIYGFPHSDVDGLHAALQRADADGCLTKIVVVEGVYSMDGDVPPLDRILETTRNHGGMLVLDDAHGTGVLGDEGRGAAELFGLEGELDVVIGTFSKALASSGGFLAASRPLIDYLRFFAKSYFFSASMPPILVAHVLASLGVLREKPERRQQLMRNVSYLREGFTRVGIPVRTDSAIVPVPVPASHSIRTLARRFDEAGIFVNHIEYPAVAVEKQRFRVSVMATHTQSDLDALLATLERVFDEAGLLPPSLPR